MGCLQLSLFVKKYNVMLNKDTDLITFYIALFMMRCNEDRHYQLECMRSDTRYGMNDMRYAVVEVKLDVTNETRN